MPDTLLISYTSMGIIAVLETDSFLDSTLTL